MGTLRDPSRDPETDMARWPRTIVGNLIAFGLALAAGTLLVQLAMALSGPVVWSLLTIALVAPLGFYVWNERRRRRHDIAVAGAPSFADTVDRMGSDRI